MTKKKDNTLNGNTNEAEIIKDVTKHLKTKMK